MTLSADVMKALSKGGVNVLPLRKQDVPRIPVCLGINYMLGGGVPRGRLTTIVSEFTGWGKTTLASIFIRAVTNNPSKMKHHGSVVLFDSEGTYDLTWAEKIGVNTDNLVIMREVEDAKTHEPRPMTGEEIQQTMAILIKQNAVDMLVLDSVKYTAFAAEQAAKPGESVWGIAARHWSAFFRQITPALQASDVALVFLNHIGTNMDKYTPDPEYGGKAIPESASFRIKMLAPKKDEKKRDHEVILRPKVYKDKLTNSRKGCQLTLYDGVLIEMKQLTDYGKAYGVFVKEDGTLIKSGGKWHFNGQFLGASEATVQQSLLSDLTLYSSVYDAVSKAISSQPLLESSDVEEETEAQQ